jgi:hypothetical protein
LLLLELRAPLRLFHLRPRNEELPAEEHDHAQDDGKDHIAVVGLH